MILMLTTLYIILSVTYYFVFDKFNFKMNEKLIKDNQYDTILLRFFKVVRLFTKANLILCAILFILKCFGIVNWW